MNRFSASIPVLILAAVVATISCSRSQDSGRDTADAKPGANARTEKPAPPPKPRVETLVIPSGTHIVASLNQRLSTETNHTGDQFGATTTEPIVVDGKTLIPAGARMHGSLRDVQASGRIKGRARMTLAYQDIVDSEGKTHSISAVPLTLQAASATRGDVEKIAAGGVLGALIGGIAGGGKGAAIGAGAGAGAGTVLMLATKGDDVELEVGQRLNVQMTSSTSVQVLAQR
jgi:hypothetical protein